MEIKAKIEKEIRSLLDNNREFRANELKKAFPDNKALVAYTIKDLLKRKVILKVGSTRGAYYVLHTDKNRTALAHDASRWEKSYKNSGLREEDVYDEVVRELPKLSILHENVRSIFTYAFSEMMNNAIEHSQSQTVDASVEIADGKLRFTVSDDGIGVFQNVMRERKLPNHYEAALDVLKGKTTTVPNWHSGEGIFFTSKSADLFTLESLGLELMIDNRLPDTFLESVASRKGTRVTFEISLDSDRHLDRDVFRPFTTNVEEPAFDKTLVHVKLYKHGTAQISRSQARRLLTGLDKFKTIVLDFERVPSVGQAFADEVFRVFRNHHPNIDIQYVHANDAVRFMVERASRNQL